MNLNKLTKTQLRKLANRIHTLLFHPTYDHLVYEGKGIQHNEMIARNLGLEYWQLRLVLEKHLKNQLRGF